MRLLLGKLYGTKVFVDNMQSHYFPYMPQLTGDREKLSGTGRPPAGPRLLPGNMYVVSVYLTNRSMYSSAEGGCWYDHGEPQVDPRNRIFSERAQAQDYCDRLTIELDAENKAAGRYGDISSVCCTGALAAYVSTNEWPAPFPSSYPRYE